MASMKGGNSGNNGSDPNTSSMKGGNSGNNGSDLNKENILKPTFDTLTEDGWQAFKAYITDIREIFL
jgi:hypothetical protein